MIAATLFSGIGAPETAMSHWHWRWCAETERFPSAVLAARHPSSINLGDVNEQDFAQRAVDIARPAVIVFGSPCQSFSVAGRRLGMDDPRGNLALVALGIIDRLKPRWFVFENVPGLLSSAEGRDFGLFLRAVDELGYCGAWASLDAQWFGLAQRRERLFFVGHLGDWRGPAAVLFEPESLCGHTPPSRQAGERPAPTIASRPTGGGGLSTDFDCDGGLIAAFGGNDTRGPIDVATACNAHGGPHGRLDFGSETFAVCMGSDPLFSHNLALPQTTRHGDPGVIAQSYPAVAFQTSQSGVREAETHATLDANNGSRRHNGAVVGSAVRRLTPRECERLQGFPDDYTAVTYRGKPAADGPRYKALGNSMAVPVMCWILERIEAVDRRLVAYQAPLRT